MGNIGIYNVGAKSVYLIVQTGRTECLAGVLREGLTCEVLVRHSYFHPVLTLRVLVMCKAYALLCGKLSREIPARNLLASIA